MVTPKRKLSWPVISILHDKERFEALVEDALQTQIVRQDDLTEWKEQAFTRSRRLKIILNRLGSASSMALKGDLVLLKDEILAAGVILEQLNSPDTWQLVFQALPLKTTLSAVELVKPQGKCNYIFRLKADNGESYIVRYHDSIGRQFLPRHDPETCVRMYLTAESLMREYLGSDGVSFTQFPRTDLTEPEPADNLSRRVRNSILVQPDYLRDHFLLSEYETQSPPMTAQGVVRLYAQSLARLHSRSRGVLQGRQSHGRVQQIISQCLDLVRFGDDMSYFSWLNGNNWINLQLRAGWEHREKEDMWGPALEQLGWRRDYIEKRCLALYTASAGEMKSAGCLLHSDYSPQNCFVDSATRSQLRMFDLDYIFVGDPAYEIGAAVNSLVRLLYRKINRVASLNRLVDDFFANYEREYEAECRWWTDEEMKALQSRSKPDSFKHTVRSLLSRGRAFAGLTLAATLDAELAAKKAPSDYKTLRAIAIEQMHWLEGELQETAVAVKQYLGSDGSRDSNARRLLRSSLESVQRRLAAGHKSVPPRDSLNGAWHQLADEVLREFVFEEGLVRDKLLISEERPRRFFSVLPLDEEWKPVPRTAERLDARLRRIEPPRHRSSPGKAAPKLDILSPVTQGYRRTFQSLTCLCYDVQALLEHYRVEFHVCVNFTDENSLEEVYRFAKTMASARRIPVTLYSLDLHEGGPPNTRWRKINAVNLMLRHILSNSKGGVRAEKHYLHFADNDIVIPPDRNRLQSRRVIGSSIHLLEQEPEVFLVSGTYSAEADLGFSALASVRKRPKYLHNAGRLFNLYGGCMTTTVGRLQKLLEMPAAELQLPLLQPSEDAYLTVTANLNLLKEVDRKKEEQKKNEELSTRFRAFAETKILVQHPEPANIVHFARRIVRDSEWGQMAATACSIDVNKFVYVRKRSFSRITQQILHGAGKDGKANYRDMLAQAWHYAIRRQLKKLPTSLLPHEAEGINWYSHKTQHQICRDLIRQRDIYESVLRTIRQGAFGAELVHLMEEAAANPGERFPEMSWLLVQANERHVVAVLRSNPYLFHWYAVAEECIANAIQLVEQAGERTALEFGMLAEERRKELCARFPLPPVLRNWQVVQNEGQDLDARPPRQRESYAIFIRVRNRERFLRYFSMIGRGKFSQDSPRRMVFLHVLGEELTRAVRVAARALGATDEKPEIEVVSTVYPKLATATVNYVGPEPRAPAERFLRCIYVQRSIRGKGERFWAVKMGDSQHLDLARCFGNFLGQLHGTTLGIRGDLEALYVHGTREDRMADDDPKRRLVDLLIEHLNQIRLFQPSAYRTWLRSAQEFLGSLSGVLKHDASHAGITTAVARILQVEGPRLSDHWEILCVESEQVHAQAGCLGHMGLYAANLFIAHNFLGAGAKDVARIDRGQRIRFAPRELKIEKIWIANNSRIAMIDPAIEAGLVLAELIHSRVWAQSSRTLHLQWAVPEMNEASLRAIEKQFFLSYFKTLEVVLKDKKRKTNNSYGDLISSTDMPLWRTRAARFAAFALLSRFHDRREYDLEEAERLQVVHLIVDLLHQGVEFPLPFR